MLFSLLIGLVLFLIWLKIFDCDITLMVYSKFADKIGKTKQSLKGQVIWVTGASSGIGEGLAVELATYGAKLILSARREKELNRVKQACLAANASNKDEDVLVLPLDILNYDSHAGAVQSVLDHFGKIDILVNNAGRSQRALAESTEIAVDKHLFDLNVLGTISLTKAVLPHMLAREQGHVACISSVAGLIGTPIAASYAMSKHALQGFFKSMRMEVVDRNVAVTLVCPGPVVSQGSANATTGSMNEEIGAHNVDDRKKVSTARCSHLVAVALANQLSEIWISRNPILFFTYIGQYLPGTTAKIGNIVGRARVKAFKSGVKDINAGISANPLSYFRK
ncbi:dehydrogenase/reductase SDR family member 7-like [Sycon ciliatum]|uniref:dehydrogenase/reductase SDR family member 7-like n=1 Tax=Sycon ciliatum TaxID=27933 RepID=UPI0031F60192